MSHNTTGTEKCPMCKGDPVETTEMHQSVAFLTVVPFTRITCAACGFSVLDECGRTAWQTWAKYKEPGFKVNPFTTIAQTRCPDTGDLFGDKA